MKRVICIVLVILVLVGAAAAAWVLYPTLNPKPVAVYSVSMLSYTGQTGTTAESYGVVTADKVQAIYVSETQKVTRIHVYDGQEVKKGDLLYSYDTTLTDLELDRKDLSIQQMEINLKTAREDLKRLNAMKPMVVTTPPVTQEGKSPENIAFLGSVYEGKGTAARPYLFWLTDGGQVTEEMVWDLFRLENKADIYVVFQSVSNDKTNEEFDREFGVRFTIVIPQAAPPAQTEPTEPSESVPEEENGSEPTETTAPTEPTAPVVPEKQYTLRFFDPNADDIGTQIDWNSGYTQSELTTMRTQKAEEIKELEFAIRIGKAELAIMRKEASDGNVVAAFDGVVASVLNPGSAQTLGQPMVKVTGGGGYYIEGSVSETERDTIRLGQAVTVSNWGTGTSYAGTVTWIGAYPVEGEESSGQDQSESRYPYRVFVDEQANLQEGAFVSMVCHGGEETENILYVENAFLVTEGKHTFAWIRDVDGLLQKRLLRTGISVDGYATPVYDGLLSSDYIAFPYDKNIREGAPTQITGTDGLYGQ